MYKRILVAVDGSEVSNKALGVAVKLAATVYARVRLVHVLEAPSHLPGADQSSPVAAAYLETLRQGGDHLLSEAAGHVRRAGVEVEYALPESWTERAGAVVVNQAKLWNADLIVVGTHGRRGVLRALMGSDAEYIVRHAAQNVLTVRGDDEAGG
ncbi:MAG: universal stress protein [Ramlibacter sp.]|nr:universal stress protein [Ramlibacter sp.]